MTLTEELDEYEEIIYQGIKQNKTKKIKKKRQRFWVGDLYKLRELLGIFHVMFNDLNQNSKLFFRFFRVSPERFYHLLLLVEGKIFKDTLMWKAISPAEKLPLTLRFLATGECQQS